MGLLLGIILVVVIIEWKGILVFFKGLFRGVINRVKRVVLFIFFWCDGEWWFIVSERGGGKFFFYFV